MPIRFRCHCGQKLRVGDDKVGHRAKCPRCHASVTVPPASDEPPAAAASEAAVATEAPVASEAAADPTGKVPPEPPLPGVISLPDLALGTGPAAAEGLPEIVIRDDSRDWVYESAPRDERLESIIDYDKVAVPRRVLYFQGVLLAVVALVSFVLGLLIGKQSAPNTKAVANVPCTLSGRVLYGAADKRPDDGSVVIVVPADRSLSADTRLAAEGLRPGDPLPADEQLSLRTIRSLGGDYARTNEAGEYQLKIPQQGRYHVLFISHRAVRSAADQPEISDVAQMGRYFASIPQLLGDRRYRWQTVHLRGEMSIDTTF